CGRRGCDVHGQLLTAAANLDAPHAVRRLAEAGGDPFEHSLRVAVEFDVVARFEMPRRRTFGPDGGDEDDPAAPAGEAGHTHTALDGESEPLPHQVGVVRLREPP